MSNEIKRMGTYRMGSPSRRERQPTVASIRGAESEQVTRWATRPLCTRYLAVTFGSQPTTLLVGDECRALSFYWGLGTLDDGEAEILGWWVGSHWRQTSWQAISADLTARGVHRIGLLIDATGTLRDPSDNPGFNEKATGIESVSTHRQRRIARVSAHAQHVQKSLSHAVRKHGTFADQDSAAAFVDGKLQRLDRRLWSQPHVRRRTMLAQTPLPVPAAAS